MKKRKIINYILFVFLILFAFNTVVFAADCNSMGEVKKDLQQFFNLLKILVPLLVIGLSAYDFIKAIAGKDEKDMKKTFKRFTKRLVLAVVFFFLPMLINVMLDLFMVDSSTCIN